MSAAAAEKWMKHLAGVGNYESFLLRHGPAAWDVYGSNGEYLEKSKDVVDRHVEECEAVIAVDRDVLVREARDIHLNEDLSLIGCAENHAGASAADHSNFVLLCRRMIIDAKPHDMQHIYLVESRLFDCRVVGIYADVTRLSPDMQDIYLDRLKWLVKSWPLVATHHVDMLADRIAKSRSNYMLQVIEDAGWAAGIQREIVQAIKSKWISSSPGSKYRFAQHVVHTLQEGILYTPHAAETFDQAVVERCSGKVLENYNRLLR